MLDFPHKGRGAVSNASGRYEAHQREAFDDGWESQADDEARPPATIVGREAARTIISRNDSPDLSFDRTINPYRGCEHGCVYCYARPNHAYVDLSPGLDFETKLFVKAGAVERLREELAAPGYEPRVIVLGGVTDVYQPIERSERLTRGLLETLSACDHPVALVTKSALVLRDLDLLADMAARRLAKVAVSVTTLDRTLARAMEPRAAAPHRRLETIRALAGAGVPVAVMAAPMIPALNDHELEEILSAARDAGAEEAGYVALRLPHEIETLFQEWLGVHAPDRAKRIMALVRSMHGGKAYDARWGVRQRGVGPYAQLLAQRFAKACARLGLNRAKRALDTSRFRPPPKPAAPLPLFDRA